MHRVDDALPSLNRLLLTAQSLLTCVWTACSGLAVLFPVLGSCCFPLQPSFASALHAEIGNTSPRLHFETKSGTLTVEPTAEGYAMQLPLLAPTDELPDVAGLPEVRI